MTITHTDAVDHPAGWLTRARAVAHRLVIAAAIQAAAWRVHLALPGLLGSAMTACGIGGLVGASLGSLYGPWAGVLAGGVFLLRIDSRVGGS